METQFGIRIESEQEIDPYFHLGSDSDSESVWIIILTLTLTLDWDWDSDPDSHLDCENEWCEFGCFVYRKLAKKRKETLSSRQEMTLMVNNSQHTTIADTHTLNGRSEYNTHIHSLHTAQVWCDTVNSLSDVVQMNWEMARRHKISGDKETMKWKKRQKQERVRRQEWENGGQWRPNQIQMEVRDILILLSMQSNVFSIVWQTERRTGLSTVNTI